MMQWLPIYLLTPMDTAGIIRTQAEVFPYTFVIRAGMLDFMVVSFKGKNAPRFSTKWMKDRIETFHAERHIAGEKWTPSAAIIYYRYMPVCVCVYVCPANDHAPYSLHKKSVLY